MNTLAMAILAGLAVHTIDFLIQRWRFELVERYGSRTVFISVFVGLILRLSNVYVAVHLGQKYFSKDNFNIYAIILLLLPLSALMGGAFLRRKDKAEDAHLQ